MVLQTLATVCGKMFKISLRQVKLFATIKTVCELVCNFLRTLMKPKIRYVRKHSQLSVIPPLKGGDPFCMPKIRICVNTVVCSRKYHLNNYKVKFVTICASRTSKVKTKHSDVVTKYHDVFEKHLQVHSRRAYHSIAIHWESSESTLRWFSMIRK